MTDKIQVSIIRCPEAKCLEAYDWCMLSDNICIRNTGNPDFDTKCEYFNDYLREFNRED